MEAFLMQVNVGYYRSVGAAMLLVGTLPLTLAASASHAPAARLGSVQISSTPVG